MNHQQNLPDALRTARSYSRHVGRCCSASVWLKVVCLTVVCLTLFSGCVNPQFARYPTSMTFFPLAENMAYQRQDPFPDPDIGPSLHSTPRGYDRPRSEARRAAEQRLFQGIPVGPESVPPGPPQGGLKRPRSVY